VSARSIFTIERVVRHKPCSKMTSSRALDADEEIATMAMKIKILENIQTVNSFWPNRSTNAKGICSSGERVRPARGARRPVERIVHTSCSA